VQCESRLFDGHMSLLTQDTLQTGGRQAGSCTAALFLKPFVDGIEPGAGEDDAPLRWAHIDIAGAMQVNTSCIMARCILMFPPQATRPTPYLEKGMTGRPVR
jgi:cytosol aminopeptidase